MTDVAQALCVKPPTVTDVVRDLVRKRRSLNDGRVYRLRLSRRGEALAQTIQHRVRQMEITLTEKKTGTFYVSDRSRWRRARRNN